MAIISKKNKKAKAVFMTEDSQEMLHKNMNFAASEQYKLLRANLYFTLHNDKKCNVVGITSSIRGEGKSTTAINTAYVLAEAGKKVLLIDGDLRIPSIAKKMNIERAPGLTNLMLNADYNGIESYKVKDQEKWYVLPAGDLPPNPSELLGSKKMRRLLDALSEKFDYIVIDLPPVNLVSDALAISPMLDGMLLVVRENYTSQKDLDHCINQLKLSNVNILGCVMNVIKSENRGYSAYKKGSRAYKKTYMMDRTKGMAQNKGDK